MTILSFQLGTAGEGGQQPRENILLCTDSLSAVTTAGFIGSNMGALPTDVWRITYAYDPMTAPSGTFGFFTTSISGGVVTLSADSSEGNVVLPTTANYIPLFSNTTGTITSAAGNGIRPGNLQAGLSGTAGAFISFPSTAATGNLRLRAASSAGDYTTIITNATLGQATTYTLPDPGTANVNFIVSGDVGGTQHINTGHLQVDTGNISAGSGGAAGHFVTYPATVNRGNLVIAAANNAGDTTTTITNASMGQASTITIPDPGDATADFLIAANALVSGNLVEAVGTDGNVANAGYRMFANTTASWGGGGTTHTFTALDVTVNSIVVANIVTSANDVAIAKVVPGAGDFAVTFTADPGAGTTLNYILTSVAV